MTEENRLFPSPLEVDIVAEAQVRRTESTEKVAKAISNLFPSDAERGATGELRVEKDRVLFVSSNLESLRHIKDQFRDRRVRSSARRLLLSNKGKEGDLQTYLLLNKQAATAGIGALCDDPRESALGPIVLRIRANQLDWVIDWLTFGYEGKTS